MNENQEPYFGEEGLFECINRFEDMLNRNDSCYFDIFEFENIIDYYIDQHNFLNARAAIERGLKQHPHSTSLKYRLAQIYIQNGKPSKGLHFLREIEGIESANCDFYLLKGSALNVLGKKDDAFIAFDQAIKLSSDAKDEVIFNIAYSYLNTRRYNLAIKYFLLANEVNPKNIIVLQELALVYEKLDKLDKSVEYYRKYLDFDPYSENIWFNLGMVYANLEEHEKAVDAYDFAIAICPDYLSAYFSKANSLISQEKYKEAIKSYEEIIFLEPDNIQAYTCIGECYEKISLYRRAIHYYKKAIDIDDSFDEAWFGIGMAYFQMEEYFKCLEFFMHANAIDIENPEYWFMLGEVYKELNIYDKSVEAYNRTVELDPNDYDAWLSHADICFLKDNLHEAIRILKKAYQYNKEISTINYNLAAYYLYNDQPNMAYEFFEKGLSINYDEHSELLNRYPLVSGNATFSKLIRKYKNFSQ
jgi:tetratricopeptide (TPR) repeat protein